MKLLSAGLVIALALGCRARAPSKLANTAPPPAARAATLEDDLAVIEAVAATSDQPTTSTMRATPLGWTADHRLAYRALICAPVAFGQTSFGQTSYCNLTQCVVASGAGPDCVDVVLFEIFGSRQYARADAMRAVAGWLAALGPLTPAVRRPASAATLAIVAHALVAELPPGGPRQTVVDSNGAAYGISADGVRAIRAPVIVDSRDGACRGAIGLVKFRGEYEEEHDDVWWSFGAARCGQGAAR